MSIPLPGI